MKGYDQTSGDGVIKPRICDGKLFSLGAGPHGERTRLHLLLYAVNHSRPWGVNAKRNTRQKAIQKTYL